jgi:UDP-2-acetamido-3-amino-2,3-dideoxy-glucuronate N-acetyltransferase|tara:strand:- start:11056 stop:12054 length:999 start_codon:yes stop_codon:yes gene_type:complete
MNKINIGLIGFGRFGQNYFRTFNELEDVEVRWICSNTINTRKEMPLILNDKIKTTIDYNDILNDDGVDAVAIVTPATTHYKIAKDAINSGKHVIVEKPLTLSSKDAEDLVKISNGKKKILMVGHIHRYNPGIQKLKEDIDKGKLGKINYIHYTHLGNGPVREDVNALWDFFPHTLTILDYFFDELPLSVNAKGACYLRKGIHDVVTVDIKLPDNVFIVAIGSWLYPFKRMGLVVTGEKKFATFDDYAEKEKLKYYDNRPKIINGKAIMEDKGYEAPKIGSGKPLTNQLKHFLDCIKSNKTPLTDGSKALKTIKVLEYAQESLKFNGMEIEIK